MLAFIDLKSILEKQLCFFGGGAQFGVPIVVK